MTNLEQLATEALLTHPNNIQRAETWLYDRLMNNRQLLQKTLTELIHRAVLEAVQYVHRKEVQTTLNDARARHQEMKAETMATALKEVLLNLALRDGTRLKDAQRPLLQVEVKFHHDVGSTMLMKSRFFSSVLLQLPDDTVTVGQTLSEVQLQKLFNAAQEAEGGMRRLA